MPGYMVSADFFCPNAHCDDYKKRGTGRIVLQSRYGREGVRLLKCRSCGKRFSERRFRFSFGLHTDEGKVLEVIRCLVQGMSYREAADASGIDKDTVNRIWKKFLSYYEDSMETFVREFNVNLEDVIKLLYTRGKGRGDR